MTARMAKYTAGLIAHWFILRNQMTEDMESGEPLTLLRLLKLMYYAEGTSLAMEKGSLFADPFIAWRHGPVVLSIWKEYTDNPRKLELTDEEKTELNTISREDDALLEPVFHTFGQFSAWRLRNMTHEEDPWIEATDNGRVMNREISRETIKAYFNENYI